MYFIKKKTFEINANLTVQSLCQKNMDENYQQSDISEMKSCSFEIGFIDF